MRNHQEKNCHLVKYSILKKLHETNSSSAGFYRTSRFFKKNCIPRLFQNFKDLMILSYSPSGVGRLVQNLFIVGNTLDA